MLNVNGEEVVISGISGRFPESDNIHEFWESLVNGVDFTTSDDRRWPPGFTRLPPRSGKVKNADNFDAQFFQIDDDSADSTDPQLRIFYEVVYEAIIDAGIIPNDLSGSNTAVVVGVFTDDSHLLMTNDVPNEESDVPVYIRKSHSVVSQYFGFTGPAFEVDTACASSFTALFEGIQLMKTGKCDKLVVGGTALHLAPIRARALMELKMTSPDGKSKCLDASVDGYCRSDAVVAILVEKINDAKRIYATIKAIETNIDGFKIEGITFPGYESQKKLMQSVITKSGLNTESVNYIEAHITGTPIGDLIESQSILDAYRNESEKKIMFGCLKSNIGHTEGAAAVCALVKIALIFQHHSIPPNINYKTPNPNISGLMKQQIVPVLKNTAFHDEIIPVNSFGFGGVNVHGLLKANNKVVSAASFIITDTIPRLVNISGRTEEGLHYAMNWIESNQKRVTVEFLSLLNDVSKTRLETGMHCRAFMILNESNVSQRRVFYGEKRRPLWFVFSGLGCQWKAMAKDLMSFPIFSESIHKCAEILKSVKIDLLPLLVNENTDVEINIISAFVSIVSVQIAIVDLLYFIELKVDGIIGLSIGEIVAGYASGCLTFEEAVLTSYYMAKCSNDYQPHNGAMAAIGLSWEECLSICPADVYPACDYSDDRITVAGSKSAVTCFVEQLREKYVFAKLINSCEKAFHIPLTFRDNLYFIRLVETLKKVIKNPKLKPSLMISTSTLHDPIYCDANYFACNLISPVIGRNAMSKIPKNACVVEIGPSGLLLPIVKRFIPEAEVVVLMQKHKQHNAENILAGIGHIYCTGNNVNIEKLYRKVEYPVPRETLSLSHLLKWDHSKSYFVAKYSHVISMVKASKTRQINITSADWNFLEGHCIDGRILFPAVGYLYLVWYRFTVLKTGKSDLNFPVEFTDVNFDRATVLSKTAACVFDISINETTGRFTIVEDGSVCVTGVVNFANESFDYLLQRQKTESFTLTAVDVYKELRIRGYDYGPTFQGLIDVTADGSLGKIKWTGHWISFLDSMLHMPIFASKERSLRIPTALQYMRCDPQVFEKAIEKQNILDVTYDDYCKICYTSGIFIKGMTATTIPRRTENRIARLTNQCFTPYELEVNTSKKQLSVIENYFQRCNFLLEKLASKNWSTTEEEEKCKFNVDSNEAYSFYKKLVVALNNKENFKNFFENLTATDKVSLMFQSNFEHMLSIQLRQIMENLMKQVIIAEFNETASKLQQSVIKSAEIYLMKYEYYELSTKDIIKNTGSRVKEVNLIVYKDLSTELVTDSTSLKNKHFISSLIKSFEKSLTEKGFLLFTYRTKLTSLERKILQLRKMCEVKLLSEIDIEKLVLSNFTMIAKRKDDFGVVSCIFKKSCKQKLPIYVKPNFNSYDWVEKLKCILNEKSDDHVVWLVAKEHEFHGVTGLTRCLKIEPGGERFRCCISNEENIPDIVFKNDLIMNYFENGKYGVYIQKDCDEIMKKVGLSNCDARKEHLASFLNDDSHQSFSSNQSLDDTSNAVNLIVDYALIKRGKLQLYEKVFIHAENSTVVKTAIDVCLSMKCEVFTSVWSEKQKQFLKSIFPQLQEHNFVPSNDYSSFDDHLLKFTFGKGVNLILSSQTRKSFNISLNCLADFGRLIEIRNHDTKQNESFDSSLFALNKTIICFDADEWISSHLSRRSDKNEFSEINDRNNFGNKLTNGNIKKLKMKTFDMNKTENMQKLKRKCCVKSLLRTSEKNSETTPKLKMVTSIPHTHYYPSKVYILFGGLGGLGLEVAFWLSCRGAKKLVLTSRTGFKNNYQRYVINKIEDSGVTVKVVANNACTFEKTKSVIKGALQLGPIGGIFNLSMVLKDALIVNQTRENFEKVCLPKINTTLYIDEIARKELPQLDYFVCFSSLVSGVGHAGQSNYGFANSVMESICEKRRNDGLHAVAVQWGPIGDTGFFTDTAKSHDKILQACVPQRIHSFLDVLDKFIGSNYAICCSMVPASIIIPVDNEKGDFLKTICHILGVSDSSSLEGSSTLVNLGMDSLMSIEIKQALEREYNTFLSAEQIRQLTIREIKEMSNNKQVSMTNQSIDGIKSNENNIFELPKEVFVKLDCGNQGIPVFFVLLAEGDFRLLQPLVKFITRPVIAIMWTEEANGKRTIQEIATFYFQKLQETYPQSDYEFVAHSFSSFVAFEICLQFQATHKRSVKRLILLDGDLISMKLTSTHFIAKLEQLSESESFRELIITFLATLRDVKVVNNITNELNSLNTKVGILHKSIEFLKQMKGYQCDEKSLTFTIQQFLDKLKMTKNYKPSNVYNGNISIIFSSKVSTSNLKHNYDNHSEMKKFVNGVIEFFPYVGDHTTILTANCIREIGNYIDAQFNRIYS